MLTPRPYQLDLVARARAAFLGTRSVLAVLPTGGGKTQVGSMVVEGALAKRLRVLWLAHRRELVDQAASRLPGEVGVLMAGRRARPAPVQVASIDTIADRDDLPPADLIVYDEAHHVVARTSRDLLARYPGARVLGLTATPCRSDGTALGDVFEALVSGPTVRELIAEGHLVEADVIGPTDEGKALAADPVAAWRAHAGGRPGFLFAKTVASSREYAAALTAAGIPAAHVDGTTARTAREAAIDGFRRGRIDVLSSVQVFTEGVDCPRAAVCMLARGCDHQGTYLQMVGRVLRPAPGKTRALVIDLVGAAHRHGLPDDDREWSLSGEPIRDRDAAIALTQCPECGAVWRAGVRRTCLRCGWEMPSPEAMPVSERPIEDLRARLAGALRARASPESQAKKLEELRGIAAAKGYKSTWVGMKFKAIFGHWPRNQKETA